MTPKKLTTLAVSCLTLATAQQLSAIERTPFQAGYTHSFDADIDDGGSVSSDLFFINGGLPLFKKDDLKIALTTGYSLKSYDFSGGSAGSFNSVDPWGDIHQIKLGSYIRWTLENDWTLFATPSVRSTGEGGASFDDTLTFRSILGATYKVNDTLTIGPAVSVRTQLEDSVRVVPILFIDWDINDSLSLTTGSSAGATQGSGIALHWDVSDALRISWGAAYENSRFRLSDRNSASAKGIGEDSSFPLYTSVTWTATEHLQASLVAGVSLGNTLTLENKSGDRIIEKDHDAAPFVGFNLGYTF